MINANMERVIRTMTEQFFQLASFSWEPGTFSSQPEVNSKGHTSSSSVSNPGEHIRELNVVISLWSGRELDNQVKNPNEPCMYPHQFFQNSSSSPPSLETGSSSKLRDAIDGVPNNSDTPYLLSHLLTKRSLRRKVHLI